jgi:hypothetical protein
MRGTDSMGVLSMEITKAWYHLATFVFESCRSIEVFFNKDWWGIILEPYQLINHVEISICERHVDIIRYRRGYSARGFEKLLTDRAASLKTSVNALYALQKNASIVVNVDFSVQAMIAGRMTERPSALYLEVLRVILSEFQDAHHAAGRDVRIFVNDASDLWKLPEFMQSSGLEKTEEGHYVCVKGTLKSPTTT